MHYPPKWQDSPKMVAWAQVHLSGTRGAENEMSTASEEKTKTENMITANNENTEMCTLTSLKENSEEDDSTDQWKYQGERFSIITIKTRDECGRRLTDERDPSLFKLIIFGKKTTATRRPV